MKSNVLITGSLGLIGFESTVFFLDKGFRVLGIDNNLRSKMLSINTNSQKKIEYLRKRHKGKYIHHDFDIRNKKCISDLFKKYSKIDLIIHTAAQTSHDWSAQDPFTDYSINSLGTLNLLEVFRQYCPTAVFIFTSTNKVYGDLVNNLNYKESKNRYDLNKIDINYKGITEKFSIDQSKHSFFGVSKASGDLLVQEYGRYFSLKTGVFRLGVVAGKWQNGALEQGFLSYMINHFKKNGEFIVFGYKGKQVRDIIHAKDLVYAFYLFYKNPKKGEVFNMGGGRNNAHSLLEIIQKISKLSKTKPKILYKNKPRTGDHKWWITDYSKFKKLYPSWNIRYSVDDIIFDIFKDDV
ncbi:NAD-dependent epimerase/dehydratase family protein [Candidatus Roizmanbacteria bacterium]|jgi:CDP-paratose 2-epimerase|nr:NAD-dependent epimerase/dehydratase family protein [Candidatus Roizmanbacteria bacterium]